MKTLWPYYSTKKKAFYRDGKHSFSIERKNKKIMLFHGVIPGKKLMWNTGDTINLSEVSFVEVPAPGQK